MVKTLTIQSAGKFWISSHCTLWNHSVRVLTTAWCQPDISLVAIIMMDFLKKTRSNKIPRKIYIKISTLQEEYININSVNIFQSLNSTNTRSQIDEHTFSWVVIFWICKSQYWSLVMHWTNEPFEDLRLSSYSHTLQYKHSNHSMSPLKKESPVIAQHISLSDSIYLFFRINCWQ